MVVDNCPASIEFRSIKGINHHKTEKQPAGGSGFTLSSVQARQDKGGKPRPCPCKVVIVAVIVVLKGNARKRKCFGGDGHLARHSQ